MVHNFCTSLRGAPRLLLFWLIILGLLVPSNMSAATPIAPDTQLFGASTHFMWYGVHEAARDLDRMKAAGITTARFDVNWKDVEPARGVWNAKYLNKLDAILGLMDERGMQAILIIVETPAWARGRTGSNMTPPLFPSYIGPAMGYLGRRYAAHPNMVYEIWNEPNDPHFWDTPGGPDAAFYTRMLRVAYTNIKAADPDATVLGGSILSNDRGYLKRMYAAGARGYFDGLALHPYNRSQAPDWTLAGQEWFSFPLAVTQMKQIMADQGEAGKPIWITEMGWSSAKVSDATRAAYYAKTVAMVRKWPYVKAFIAYTLNQTENSDIPYGFFTRDGQALPSWTAYTQAVRDLSAQPAASGTTAEDSDSHN